VLAFLLAKKKILLEAVKNILTSKVNDKVVEGKNIVNEVKASSSNFFLPDNTVFLDVDKEIKNKNFSGFYKRVNRLNPVGFTSIVTEHIK